MSLRFGGEGSEWGGFREGGELGVEVGSGGKGGGAERLE